MHYAEFEPTPALAPFVQCVWTFEADATHGAPTRVVPDGRPELVVHFGDPFAEVDADGGEHVQPRVLFAGQVTRPLVLKPLGRADVVGVRFRPAGAVALVGRSMRGTADARLDASALLAEDLLASSARKTDAHERMHRVQRAVAARAERHRHLRDPLVEAAVARLAQGEEKTDVAGLADAAGLGRRQFERRFGDMVGIGPALLGAILRFRRVFDILERDAARPWTDAALAGGYHDQSHFIREFRRFVGQSPTEFQRSATAFAEALAQPRDDVAIVQAAPGAGP